MGIFIPERYGVHTPAGKTSEPQTEHLKVLFLFRDASWELEANAYSELLEVYTHCDADTCLCRGGRTHSAKTGYGRSSIRSGENSRLICGFLRFKLVQGGSLSALWLQGNSQEVLEAEGRQQRLGLWRLHEGHGRHRSGRLARARVLHESNSELLRDGVQFWGDFENTGSGPK